jgi:transmembrane sensor
MTDSGGDRLLNAVAEVAQQEWLQLPAEDISGAAFAELSNEELQALAGSVSQRLVSKRLAHGQIAALEAGGGEARQRRRGFGRRLGWLAAAAAVLGTSLWLVQSTLPTQERVAQQQPAPSSGRRLSLPDGSTLALAEQTEAHLVALTPGEARVQLEHGSVECEVAHNPDRRFVVAAGAFEVVVKGTHFTVSSGLDAAAPAAVAVSVERGLVEVRQPPDRVLALLGAGQSWASNGLTTREPSAGEAAPPSAVLGTKAESSGVAGKAPKEAPVTAKSSAVPQARAAAPIDARRLFERADGERLAGHAQQAAAAFDELRRRYPEDARAGYAAFMLGRIQLDSLGDPNAAADAFAFAIAHPGGGFFLEDAQARRVEALSKAGRSEECRRERDQFLARHSQALRAAFVAKLCATP